MRKTISSTLLLALALLTAPVSAEPGPTSATSRDYRRGVRLARSKSVRDARDAAPLLWSFLRQNPPEAEESEDAEFLLAKMLNRLGYHHAAVEHYVNVARGRGGARLVGASLDALAKTVSSRPHDVELILRELISDTHFGHLPPDVREFVAYHQGLTERRDGLDRWAKARFATLTENARFRWQLRYDAGLARLAANDVTGARRIFEEIEKTDVHDDELARRVRLTLARLDFEAGEYRRALERYDAIELPIEERAEVMLERAWCHYRLGNHSKALGLLVALDAPTYRDFDDPEQHTLRALMFRDLCHYGAASKAVKKFRKAYAPAIEKVHGREDLVPDHTFRALALEDSEVAERAAFVDALHRERALLSNAPKQWSELEAHLRRVYDLAIARSERRLEIALEAAEEEIGERFLEAEEQMDVLDYEIDLARNRRARNKPPETGKILVEAPWTPEVQYYEFDGEYWNDELEDMQVVLENRCEGMTPEGRPRVVKPGDAR